MNYAAAIKEILEASRVQISDIAPSQWCEENRIMTTEETPFPGPFSYSRTPYCMEIVDCLSPNHPAKVIAVMKGAQIGFTSGVLEPGIAWIISQNPGNILFLTGHSDLSDEAMNKIDKLIDNCGLRKLIRPSVLRKKNMRTGDTNKSKEFPGGSLVAGSAGNHKLLRQRSVRFGFIDDFEAAKHTDSKSGSTTQMIEARFNAYRSKMKLYYISTPELKQTSNIEPVFLKGDQRRYFMPCPCCGDFIALYWTVEKTGTDGKEKAGITWKLDDDNKLIVDSVGYTCQSCGDFFKDTHKSEMLLNGHWQPTAQPVNPSYYSYHISSLYAPLGMKNWAEYVQEYLEANPPDGAQKADKHQAFVNLCLGETYEQQGEAPQANQLQKNVRGYVIGTIPESLSIKDGNGEIILLTCAADLNGIEEDARLDYEIVGWSETGASYSITHGSIGTFVPREGAKRIKEDRERWTYEHHRPNSVWTKLEEIISARYKTDTGREMIIAVTGVDTGHYTLHAYNFIDRTNNLVVGLKGKDVERFIRIEADAPNIKPAQERAKLFIVAVNQIKDDIAEMMRLKWDSGNDDKQPAGFMNFPIPSDGKYLYSNFFSHYESEQRVIETDEGKGMTAKWVKKSTNSQNHFWDVRVYNIAMRDVFLHLIAKEAKTTKLTWGDYVTYVNQSKKVK